MERKTRLELATPTLARWCSTTELLPHWWCSGTELNRRHGDFQSPALPTELPEHLATPIRFELTIFAVTGRHVKPLHHGAICFHSSGLSRYFLVPRTKTILLQNDDFGKYYFLNSIIFFRHIPSRSIRPQPAFQYDTSRDGFRKEKGRPEGRPCNPI